uniref:Uncharacterized protein n=1 Tax=Meloidogyne hapla TaxID=6305 RepID=A0A1I8BMU8_MELHA
MLNISIEEAEQSFTREQMLLLDKLNEFKWPKIKIKRGKDTKMTTFYRQCTLELALTLNSTPANPICIVQFYSHAIENFVYFNKTLARLRSVGNELLGNLKNKYELPDKECQQRKIEQLKELLVN